MKTKVDMEGLENWWSEERGGQENKIQEIDKM